MDFSSVLAAARKIETRKENSQLSIRLKEKSQEPSPRRFPKSKPASKSKKSTTKKRKSTSSIPVLSLQKRSKPLPSNSRIATSPINGKPNLKSISKVDADLIVPFRDGTLFRQTDDMKKAKVCVGNVSYQAFAIHAFETQGGLVLNLYTVWLDPEEGLSEEFVAVTF